MINCPYFEKKGSCRFHETTGTCWYGEASPPVNLVVGLPYPPLPGSALPADVGVAPLLRGAIGVDFGTETEPWFSSHSSTQTVPSETIDADLIFKYSCSTHG